MKNTGIVRNLDEVGRLVIPKEICKSKNISAGELFEMFIDDDHIVLRKYVKKCALCGQTSKPLSKYKKALLCEKCYSKINKK